MSSWKEKTAQLFASDTPREPFSAKKLLHDRRFKKILIYIGVLLLFILVTNPALLPFLSEDARASIGNVWTNLFGDVDTISGMFVINWATLFQLVAMVLLLIICNKICRLVLDNLHPASGKGKSLVSLASSVLSYVVTIVGVLWGLSIIGVNVSTIFASVGIVVLIVSFGAESLIEDVVTGVFLVFEDQFNVGDIIELDGFRGTVDRIGIRTTCIRDASGNVKIVNNSDIRNVLNRSVSDSMAVCDMPVAYGEDLQRVEDVLTGVFPVLMERYPDVFHQLPVYQGVQELSDSSVNLRVVAKVSDQNIYAARRILNREFKLAFDKAGVEIPFQQVVVHSAKD
jgi:small-conductance mechanosensitive channel